MNKLAINPNDIDTIFISHFHADHIGGLPFFILECELCPQAPARPHHCRAAGPQIALCGDHGVAFPGTKTMQWSFPLTLQELEIGRRSEIGNLRVTPFHVVHDDRAGPCLGFRFEAEGKVIAFSGDTNGRKR